MGAKFNQEELKNRDKENQASSTKRNEKKEAKEEKPTSGKFKIENYILGEFEFIIPSYKKISSFKVFPIEIKEIEEVSIEKFSLCDGATLKCNQGDASSTYTVLPTKKSICERKTSCSSFRY